MIYSVKHRLVYVQILSHTVHGYPKRDVQGQLDLFSNLKESPVVPEHQHWDTVPTVDFPWLVLNYWKIFKKNNNAAIALKQIVLLLKHNVSWKQNLPPSPLWQLPVLFKTITDICGHNSHDALDHLLVQHGICCQDPSQIASHSPPTCMEAAFNIFQPLFILSRWEWVMTC